MSQPRTQFAKFCWAVLAYNLLVILWGAFVRVSESGAGCGNHWPLCNGEVIPLEPSMKTVIELSHRLTSGLALIAVVVMLVWAFRLYSKGHRVRGAAIASVVLMLGEAAIGAGIVLFELVAENESMARAMFMGAHLMNTFLLLGALTLTAYWASGGDPVAWLPRVEGSNGRRSGGSGAVAPGWGERGWFAAAVVGSLLVGVSGAVAALGDTLFPAGSLEEALRQDWSATSHVLIRLRLLHPLIAVVVGLYLIFLGRSLARTERSPLGRRLGGALVLVVLAQLALGTLNVALLAPAWLQLVHLLVADTIWILLVLLLAVRLRTPSRAQASVLVEASAPA